MKANPTPLDQSVLRRLEGTSLFYPCSGNDLLLPLATFGPFVSDFWFVDSAYFRRSRPEEEPPILSKEHGYTLLDKQIRLPTISEEDWIDDEKYDCKPPPILTESYRHITSGRMIRVHRHRRRGPSALRREIDRLGVFFYRGDNDGDAHGGSGTLWLTVHRPKKRRRWLIHEVLDKLIDGGLIVTDGSMCQGEHNPYREIARFRSKEDILRDQAVGLAQSFHDDRGHFFQCIGYCGYNRLYSPTLIWQVHRGIPHENTIMMRVKDSP